MKIYKNNKREFKRVDKKIISNKLHKKKSLKLSIIVPNLNNVRYLVECLDSIINQTLRKLECIIVDSGSTDGSITIINEYIKKDQRLRLIEVDKKSYGYQMNIGISNAQGEYIGIVESDDFVDIHMFEDLYSIAIENNCDMVKSDFYRFVNNDEEGSNEKYKNFYIALDKSKKFYNRVINTSENIDTFLFPMNTWSGIYKKSFLDKYKINHNESPGASYQDNGFFFKTFINCKRAYFTNKAYYMNRRDNENSSVFSKGKMYAMTDEYEFIKRYIDEDPEREKYNKFYYYKKFMNYLFTYNRLDKENKDIYYRFIRREFEELIKNRLLDTRMFSKEDLRSLVFLIGNYPEFKKRFG